jgi:hypothetical protein
VGPGVGLDPVEKRKYLAPAGNRTLAVEALAGRCTETSFNLFLFISVLLAMRVPTATVYSCSVRELGMSQLLA